MTDDPQTPDSAAAAPPEPASADERLAALERELADARRDGLAHLRRALLAEHAGSLVPELVAGDSSESLEASVAVATAAFEAAREAALAELRREQAARTGATGQQAGGPTAVAPAGTPTTPAAAPGQPYAAAQAASIPSVPAATPARDLVEPEPRSPLQRIAVGLGHAY